MNTSTFKTAAPGRARSQPAVKAANPPIHTIAAAITIGALYLLGLMIIRQLAG